MEKEKKHLSSIANDVIQRCAQELQTSADTLIKEFEAGYEPVLGEYSRKLVEYCASNTLMKFCGNIHEKVSDGCFSRFTFDMMLAWQTPDLADEELKNESAGKEKEDRKVLVNPPPEHDEVPLFYSDIMPLLVDHEDSVSEEAFVWLATLVPLTGDVVNGRFTFETLTASSGHQLHFPAYDKFMKEIDKCIRLLQKQEIPTGVELADDEFILHVDGTATTQRVVRHIGGTSWPGRLTLTNYALYFEAYGVVSYEDALKIDLSEDIEQSAKPAATGPWGAPLYDKAIVYESSELQESVILEFPEMTSSTRRDHWLALLKEIMLVHKFLSKFSIKSPVEAWEMHARTILGIIRLHAAREMLRIAPPVPQSFLIFSLFDELPKGDYVLEELAANLKNIKTGHPCSASTVLRSLIASKISVPCSEVKKLISDSNEIVYTGDVSSLETTVNEAREEALQVDKAKATAKGLKEEGVMDSAQVLLGLLKPLYFLIPLSQEICRWEKPSVTVSLIITLIVIIYKESVGKAISALLLGGVAMLLWARRKKIGRKYEKVVISTAGSDRPAMESIVSAQQGLRTLHEVMQYTNIAILKLWSIITSRSPKHTNDVMVVMSIAAIILAVIPFKFILLMPILFSFMMTSKLGKKMQNEQGNRRLREWWDSIPVVPVQLDDKVSDETI